MLLEKLDKKSSTRLPFVVGYCQAIPNNFFFDQIFDFLTIKTKIIVIII